MYGAVRKFFHFFFIYLCNAPITVNPHPLPSPRADMEHGRGFVGSLGIYSFFLRSLPREVGLYFKGSDSEMSPSLISVHITNQLKLSSTCI